MSIFSSHDVSKILTELVDKLAEKSANAGLTAEQLTEILTKVGENSATAMQRSLKPENPDHPHISAYFSAQDANTYGGWANKPALRVKTFFCGVEENVERLTPLEITSYNRLTEDREARGGRWKAFLKNKGHKNEELWVNVPCETVDQRMDLPSLTLILHELNGGQSTEDVQDLLRQIDVLKSQLVAQGATPAQLEAEILA